MAICTEDRKSISQANGIGPKTAARIILELKDKLKSQFDDSAADDAPEVVVAKQGNNKLGDAQDALTVLGYSRNEALSALKSIDTQNLELDEIIKLALKKLMK